MEREKIDEILDVLNDLNNVEELKDLNKAFQIIGMPTISDEVLNQIEDYRESNN